MSLICTTPPSCDLDASCAAPSVTCETGAIVAEPTAAPIFVEGFEFANDLSGFRQRWLPLMPTALVGFTDETRKHGTALSFQDDTFDPTLFLPLLGPQFGLREFTFGAAVWFRDARTSPFLRMMTTSVGEALGLYFVRETASSGHLEVRRGLTVLGSTTSLPSETWLYVEMSGVVDDAPNGSFELRVGQVTAAKESGIDARLTFGGTSPVRLVHVGFSVAPGGEWRIDDVYLTPKAQSFCGDVTAVEMTLDETVDAGWPIGLPGAMHHENLIENSPDGDASFIAEDSDSVAEDIFGIAESEFSVGSDSRCRLSRPKAVSVSVSRRIVPGTGTATSRGLTTKIRDPHSILESLPAAPQVVQDNAYVDHHDVYSTAPNGGPLEVGEIADQHVVLRATP